MSEQLRWWPMYSKQESLNTSVRRLLHAAASLFFMQHYFYHITDLSAENKLITDLPHKVPILYRWWFPEGSEPVEILRNYKAEDLLSQTLTTTIGNTKYYALYIGKGINGRRRLKNHLNPRKRTSTLRRTLSGLLNTDDESKISKVLQECYYEWCEMACSKDELSDREEQAIKDGYYPLNLSENDKISKEWRQFLQQRRSANN